MTGSAPAKWDVHTHTTPAPETYDALSRFSRYESFVRVRAAAGPDCAAEIVDHRGEVQRGLGRNAFHAEARVAECDLHGVTMQVISPTPMMLPDAIDSPADAAEICRILNDANLAIVQQFPARFTALGALPMRHPEAALRELERCHRLGLRGIEVNSNVDGLDLDDALFFPVFEHAARLDMAIFIHPWGGFMAPREEKLRARMHAGRNWRPWLLGMGLETALAFDSMRSGGVHERLPHLRVLYAHGGGAFPALLGRSQHGSHSRPELFPDRRTLDPYETLRDCAVYTDSLTHDPWTLQLLLHQFGAQRIAMGSDYPYPLGEIDFSQRKPIYPGHMIEHLPQDAEPQTQDDAWRHFPWLGRNGPGSRRTLPVITAQQKQQMLHLTARQWLRCC